MAWNKQITPIQTCAIISLICSFWNLFGDLYFIDFTLAYMNFDGFGNIDTEFRSGNLFDLSQDWLGTLAQAGGWMYPIWAIGTVYPLYLGMKTVLPCALLAYGLCVVGGNLHSGYAFATILPKIFFDDATPNDEEVSSIINTAQSKIMDCYVFGYTPGPLAVFIASGWILYLVLKNETKFPKWFAFCTPIVTIMWVCFIGFIILPWPIGFYLVGSFGTWILFVMNAATSWLLWNEKTEIVLLKVYAPADESSTGDVDDYRLS